MYENRMKLEFPSSSDNEYFARAAAAAFVMSLDPTMDQFSELKTAISEAVTNAIIHGYDGAEGIVTMEGYICGRNVEFVISDEGVGIPDIRRARQPLFTGKPEMERSGMGFTIMEAFMDSVDVESAVGKGTRVTLRKSYE